MALGTPGSGLVSSGAKALDPALPALLHHPALVHRSLLRRSQTRKARQSDAEIHEVMGSRCPRTSTELRHSRAVPVPPSCNDATLMRQQSTEQLGFLPRFPCLRVFAKVHQQDVLLGLLHTTIAQGAKGLLDCWRSLDPVLQLCQERKSGLHDNGEESYLPGSSETLA